MIAARRLLLAVLTLLVAAALGAAALALTDARRPAPRVAPQAATAGGTVEPVGDRAPPRSGALAVLADWDRRRSAAWATGDGAALRSLYAPGSRAGRRDIAMLGRWTSRGWRVRGLRMQVLAVQVRDAEGPRLVLDVTDRLAGGVAVGRRTTRALPRDGWSTRRIKLQRFAGTWRVASVRTLPAAPP